MKLVFSGICAIVLVLATLSRADFDAPTFETSEEMRRILNDYYGFLDDLTYSSAFKWFNGASGTPNTTVLAQMQSSMVAFITARTTTTFRQCNRLTENCFACQNGAANVSAAELGAVVGAKLVAIDHDRMDADSQKTGPQTFTLRQNVVAPFFTAKLPCRAVSTCFPNASTPSQLAKGELHGPLLVTFKRVSGSLFIDRFNLGSRYSFISASETGTGVAAEVLNYGPTLVPDSVMDNTALVGVFCLAPSKRRNVADSVVYYTHYGLPLLDTPY